MIVACVNAGNYQRRGKEYVFNLCRMVKENAKTLHRFICLTDDKEDYGDIEKQPLPKARLHGWWNKLGLFEPDRFPKGERVIYFDLDILIIRNIDDILSYDGSFAMLGAYRKGASKQSGIMAWEAGKESNIWNHYVEAGFPQNLGGDQDFIVKETPNAEILQTLFPDKFYPYKPNKGIFPEKASVVVFNGHPKPHELNDWTQTYYRRTHD